MKPRLLVASVLCIAFWLPVAASGQDAPPPMKPPAKPAPAKPATHKVEAGVFKIEVVGKGVVEAEEMHEIAFRSNDPVGAPPPPLHVVKSVDHGARVKKGDPLVVFDAQRLDFQIKELVAELKSLDATLKVSTVELAHLEKTQPSELSFTQRAKKLADEDLKRFIDIDRPQAEREVKLMLKSGKFSVDSAREELKQVEKMYKANDLTEETEQIILKRTRFYLEFAEESYKETQLNAEKIQTITLPRKAVSLADGVVKAELQLLKTEAAPLTLDQKKLALAKLDADRERAGQRLDQLRKDREGMTLASPIDGVVYLGRCVRGQWIAGSDLATKLMPNGVVQPNEVVMTVINPFKEFTRILVAEKDVEHLKIGLKGRFELSKYPGRTNLCEITGIVDAPNAAGQFELRVKFIRAPALNAFMNLPISAQLLPGMACSVKLVPVMKEKAIGVPASAVFADDTNDTSYVLVVAKGNDKPQRRTVTRGMTSGSRVEITKGLAAGDEILLENPADRSSRKGE